MAKVGDLVLDDQGWSLAEATADVRRWMGGPGDQRLVRHFATPAPPPFRVGDVAAARRFVRELAVSQGQGIVEVDWVPLGRNQALRSVVKEPQPSGGTSYVGHLAWSTPEEGWAAEVRCDELGATGGRESAVALALGVAPQGFLGRLLGRRDAWAADPYEPDLRTPVLRCRADDRQWDTRFPDHPLSRCRRHLDAILRAVRPAAG